jgi:DNA-binding MarR family transcriptional regulator
MGLPDEPLSETVAAGRTLARLSRTIERCCTEVGLNLAQYRLLVFICRAPQRAGALADQDAVSGPSLTARVDALEAKGLVRRSPVEGDRRGVELTLTDEGHEVLDRIESGIDRRLRALFPTDDGRELLAALARAHLTPPSRSGGGSEARGRSRDAR